MISNVLNSKVFSVALAFVGVFGATQATAADESIASSNIAAIYTAESVNISGSGNITGQKADVTPLLEGPVAAWRDPSSVDLGLEAPAEQPMRSRADQAEANVALENIRGIFNTYSDD